MNVYYDMTRAFVERLRGPNRAAGMGRVVHSWGRSVAKSPGGSLITGLPRSWVEHVIQFESSFSWMSEGQITTGGDKSYFPAVRNALEFSGRRQALGRRMLGSLAFRSAEAASRSGIGQLFRAIGGKDEFIYHIPLPEALPRSLPASCIPVINVYDIMAVVFRDTYSNKSRRRFREAIQSVVAHGGHIIVNSRDTKHSLVCFFNVDSEHVHVVPLGSDVEFDAESGVSSTAASTEKPFLLYAAGSAQRRKNIAGTIRGFADFLGKTGAKADLMIVGGGTQEFQSYADNIIPPEQGSVHCLGLVDGETLKSLFEKARIGLYLSLYEGFGLPILEYMHRGLPVVCGNATSLPEVAGAAAVMVDAMDPASIGSGIASLWNDPVTCNRLVAAGKVRASEFTWSESSRILQDTYSKIADTGTRSTK